MNTKPFVLPSCRLLFLSLAFILVVSPLFFSTPEALASTSQGSKSQKLVDKPIDEVITDLQEFIPTYIKEQNIPGVALALIRDNEVVWKEGYGVANILTRQPVIPDMLFDVASNDKVVTAYIALRLVDQGMLSLDEPLNMYLDEDWLPPSEYRDAVTLRRVLSHTSGLGHLTPSRELRFEPGKGYSYSAIGILYTRAVIEQVTGKPFDQVAQEMVFEPLGMSSSSFVNRSDLVPRTANGHIRSAIPVVLFMIPFLICFLFVGLLWLMIQRLRTGRWHLTWKLGIVILAIAYLITCLQFFILLGELGFPEYAWLVLISGFAVVVTILVASWAGRAILTRIIPSRKGLLTFLTVLWVIVVVVGIGFIVLSMGNLPVSKNAPVETGSAGIMHSTAEDLAKFLIEIAAPKYLSAELSEEMQSAQVWLANDLAWGLGPGIQYDRGDYVLWQWGQTIDFQSVMMINPQTGSGVVVWTNSDMLNPDVAIDIAHRSQGGKIEPIHRAVNLEFDYQGPFLEQ
jgi:CubicO group peptidase (beta-lactamase class C family)